MQAYYSRTSFFLCCFFSLFFFPSPFNSYRFSNISSSPMAASSSSLKALVVFRNRINKELIRTVHVYQLEGGAEEVAEREYMFRENIDYEEIQYAGKVFTLHNFDISAHSEGLENGVWNCIYVFNASLTDHPNLELLPEDLSISRYFNFCSFCKVIVLKMEALSLLSISYCAPPINFG